MKQVYENEMQLIRTCMNMRARGIKINRKYVEEALAYETGQFEQAKKDFEKDTGRTFKDSPKLFAEIFDERGEEYPLTAKGNPSFKAEVLEPLNTPTANAIKKIRFHEKRTTAFYTSYLYQADSHNVIHANIKPDGTTTGRFSYSDPNLQQCSKEEGMDRPYYVRGCFVPRPGFKFFAIDYEQQEYRVMIDYAGERELIDRVMSGEDVHQATADMLGIDRKRAKTINFGLLYGIGQAELARQLGVSVREAQSLKQLYFSRLRQVSKFIRAVQRRGETRGFVYNWLGRRMHIDHRSYAYKLPNHLIQGSCADIIKVAMNKIDLLLAGMSSSMLVQVHDELLLEIADNEEHIIPDIVEIMESVYPCKNNVKLTTSVEMSSTSWANKELKPWKSHLKESL